MLQSPIDGAGYFGFKSPTDGNCDFNAQTFLVWSILRRISTATLVKIQAVTNAGGIDPVGFVDVLPLVNQVDGAGNSVPHATVYGMPYFRIQGGGNAIILDPQVGDIGIAVFGDRDLSSVKATKAQANPGSNRMFDFSDGLYIGGVLNGTPVQYIQFSGGGITVSSPTKVTITAPTVEIDGATVVVHASTELAIDADGNGTVFKPTTRDDYSIGSTTTSHPLNPPKVPS